MSSGMEKCLVYIVTPSPDQMMIVGGVGAVGSVEECVVWYTEFGMFNN